jgi:hypothetical protein
MATSGSTTTFATSMVAAAAERAMMKAAGVGGHVEQAWDFG